MTEPVYHSMFEVKELVGRQEYERLIESVFLGMENEKRQTAMSRIREAIKQVSTVLQFPEVISTEIIGMRAEGVVSDDEAAALAVKNLLLPADVGVSAFVTYKGQTPHPA